MRRAWLIGALGAMLSVSSVNAEIRIARDPGGQIGTYLQTFSRIRDSGEHVVIDGPCLSACTLVLAVVPRERICVTQRALLGFHAAWVPDANGRPVHSPSGTQTIWSIYPQPIRNWITRNGGLSRKMIFLRGRQLAQLYRPCR